MNIDFGADPGFSAYVLLLMLSGIVMVVLATPVVRDSPVWLRIVNAVAGLGFFGYGVYLAFFFQGGSYLIFFKAFILPVVLAFKTVRDILANPRRTTPAAAVPADAAAE